MEPPKRPPDYSPPADDARPDSRRGSYEISIRCELDDYTFAIEHPHPGLPDRETIVALKNEAVDTFAALYGTRPNEVGVWMTYYSPETRELEPAFA